MGHKLSRGAAGAGIQVGRSADLVIWLRIVWFRCLSNAGSGAVLANTALELTGRIGGVRELVGAVRPG